MQQGRKQMITHKKIAVKREIRTLKHSNESYEYKLDYAVTYKDGQIHSISKHERKYFDVSVQGGIEQRGGLYMNPINPLSNAFAKAKAFIEAQS
jgi:hypothetical protein